MELGSRYELAFQNLQKIWGQELKLLAVFSEQTEPDPAERPILGLNDALARLEGREVVRPKTRHLLAFLKQGEKQDFETLQALADKARKDLLSSARQRKDREERIKTLERLNLTEVFRVYLSERLPRLRGSPLLAEWISHLKAALEALQAGPIAGRGGSKRFELTFLDKSRDFVRSVRFADSQRCCFNSTQYHLQGDLGSGDWIAHLHADPLSFILDIRGEDSTVVSGFVFGRIGADP